VHLGDLVLSLALIATGSIVDEEGVPGRNRAISRGQGRARMTIHRLLQNTPLGPEDIEHLVAAYEQTLRALSVKERDDPLAHVIAQKVIDIRQSGIRDPAQITELALKQLGLP
jgi:hypothetical protein